MNKNIIEKVLVDASKDKRIVKINARLKKNGQFTSINGQVHKIKTAKDGHQYVVFKNFNGHKDNPEQKWQNIPVNLILAIRKDGFLYKV